MTNIQILLESAQSAANAGDFAKAKMYLTKILASTPEHAEALGMLGLLALSTNQGDVAITHFESLQRLVPDNPWVKFDLGRAYEMQGDWQAAGLAYLAAWNLNPNSGRYALYLGAALDALGRHRAALELWSLAVDQDPMVRAAHQNSNADNQTQAKSLLADKKLRSFFTNLHQKSLKKSGNVGRLQTSLWPQTHDGQVYFADEKLKPWIFYAPDLPKTSVFKSPDATWVFDLQNASADIRSEYLAYMQIQQDSALPYLAKQSVINDGSCDHLIGQQTWTAVHLYKDGQAQDCLNSFPKTKAALATAPLVYFNNAPMEVFFSVLKPGVHIPPHFGTANTRLTAHLPLIIPSKNCRIRVDDRVHHWQEGELFLFDDGWDHEAWNDSEETRVVLIFEAWRPDLSKNEIKAIQTSFKDRDQWLKDRKSPTRELFD